MASYVTPALYIPPLPGVHLTGPYIWGYTNAYRPSASPPMVYTINRVRPATMPMYSPVSRPVWNQMPSNYAMNAPVRRPAESPPPYSPAVRSAPPEKQTPMEAQMRRQALRQLQVGATTFLKGVSYTAIPVALLGIFYLVRRRPYATANEFGQVTWGVIRNCLLGIGLGGVVGMGWAYKNRLKALWDGPASPGP